MHAQCLRTVCGATAGTLLLAALVWRALETPVLLLGAAVLPAAVVAVLVLLLARRALPPPAALVIAFLWGAAGAPALAEVLNPALRDALRAHLADPATLTTALGGPLIEEGTKALALVVLARAWRHGLRDVRAGIVLGALIGIGFAMAENLTYFAAAALQRGAAGLLESVYLRAALGACLHPTFTACCGAGLGWAAHRRGGIAVAAAAFGFGIAVLLHALWNGIGAPWLHTAPCAPGAAACALDGRVQYWLLTAPAITALFIAPGLLALHLAVRATGWAAPRRG